MKAILFHHHGGPEVLKYSEVPNPETKPGEVLVKLRAASLNRLDLTVRKGWPGLHLDFPHINGADGAGDVIALGSGANQFHIGDRVVINANLGCGKCEYCLSGNDNMCREWNLLGETVNGTYVEFISLPERQLYKLPPEFDYHSAAAAALVYQTAWHSLISRGCLHAGETVLIVGAGGGVNTACLQVAKLCGAQVIVVGSNAEKLKLVESLGADALVDRSKQDDWSKAVYLATAERGVDVVVDNVGTTFKMSLRSLRKGGRLLTVGSTGAPTFEIDNRFIFAKHLSIIGSTMSPLKDFRTVMDLVVSGKLNPVLDKTFALKDAAIAQERLEKNEQFGKITLEIG
jgi:NADPH:quinone reductase-like Zn-dependent oxidoreductase